LQKSNHSILHFYEENDKNKTTSKFSDDENTQMERSQSPPPNIAAGQTSDKQPLSETPLHTILPDMIIHAVDPPKSSKSRSFKKPIIKLRPNPTRRSNRMKKSSNEPKVSHVNLVSDEEKKTNSSDDEMEEDPEEEIEEDPEEEKVEEDSKQTLSEIIKSVKASSKKGKKIAAPSPSKENSPSQKDEDDGEEEESEEKAQEEEEKSSSKKYGKGKDIAKVAAVIRAQKAEKIALRPISRTTYFEFESLETKGWNLKKFTDPQGCTNFVTLQEHTYEHLVREFYTNLSVKEKKNVNEKFLISSVKGVKIEVTQEFLSQVLNIPNEDRRMFSSFWFEEAKVNRNQLIIKYTKENKTFNSTNLEDTPKILHNMIRHTLLPRCGSFDVISDIDLCIIYHLMNKTKLNLCYIIIQHMIDSCLAIKQTVVGLPYGMHLTPLFQKVNVPLEGEERRLDFMTFSSKTIGQLHITTSNMSSSTTSGTSGSIKRSSN